MKLLIVILFLIPISINAQDLKQHQWKNRLVLIIADNINSKKLEKQIHEFQNFTKDFKDRKLITYKIVPKKYYTKNKGWVNSSELYQKFKTKESGFKIVLIGLDGTIKLSQNNVIKATELFRLIDTMPMRKLQLLNTNN